MSRNSVSLNDCLRNFRNKILVEIKRIVRAGRRSIKFSKYRWQTVRNLFILAGRGRLPFIFYEHHAPPITLDKCEFRLCSYHFWVLWRDCRESNFSLKYLTALCEKNEAHTTNTKFRYKSKAFCEPLKPKFRSGYSFRCGYIFWTNDHNLILKTPTLP